MSATISPPQLASDIQQTPDQHFLVDVRSPGEYRGGHIPGALNHPVDQLDGKQARQLEQDANGRQVVFICQSGKRSKMALHAWSHAGLEGAIELDGGMNQWPANAPLKKEAKAPLPLQRQVQITVGTCALIGTLLGAFANPWFLLIPGFMGAGLLFAGLTGTCGLALMLSQMPWNR